MEATTESNSRPSNRSDEILTCAAQQLLTELGDKEIPPEDSRAVEQLVKAMKYCSSLDGYEICRELERSHYWSPDSQMVDVFDGAFSAVHQVHRAKVADWVASNGIRAQKAIGDQVEVLYRGQTHLGEIVKISAETAEYTVMIPALGHVREGLGTHGTIFKFEDIHPLGEPVEEFELRSQTPRG